MGNERAWSARDLEQHMYICTYLYYMLHVWT